jgi:hypothetical protein
MTDAIETIATIAHRITIRRLDTDRVQIPLFTVPGIGAR